jgi:hypothetical protein
MRQTRENFEMNMNVVTSRPRDAITIPKKHALDVSNNNVCQLLNRSRYELYDHSSNDLDSQKNDPDDFNCRMSANFVALMFLVALTSLAAVDVLKLMNQI